MFIRKTLLPAFVVTLIVPSFYWTNYWAYDNYLNASYYAQIAGVIIFGLAAILLFKAEQLSYSKLSAPVIAFGCWTILSGVWSINPLNTVIGCVALAIYVAALIGVWELPARTRAHAFQLSALVLLGGLAALALSLGLTHRSFGGVTPNLIAHFAFTAMILMHMGDRFKKTSIALALLVIVFAQGRTVFIAAIAFLAMYYVFLPYAVKFRARALSFSLLTMSMLLIVLTYSWVAPTVVEITSDLTGVESDVRLSTDFTGRTELWEQGIDLIRDQPAGGYGFKTRGEIYSHGPDSNSHSGVLNLLLDLGIVGGALFFIWYLSALFFCVRMLDPRLFGPFRTCGAFLVANIPILIAEPNYTSFAHPTALIMLLALTCPISFEGKRGAVILAAQQGKPRRRNLRSAVKRRAG